MVAPAGDFTLQNDVFEEPFYGVDLSPAMAEGLGECARANLAPSLLLADPQRYHTYITPLETPFDQTLRFTFSRAGRLRALAGWFEAQLAGDVTLTTAPGYETHWMQHLFPLPPTQVEAGESLEIRLWLADNAWHWSGAIAGRSFAIDEVA